MGQGRACAAVAARQSLSKKVGKMRTSSRAAEDCRGLRAADRCGRRATFGKWRAAAD